MYKAAVIGDKDSVYAFAALGMAVYTAQSGAEAAKILHTAASGGAGVIFITEQLAAAINEDIQKYRFEAVPAIIPIPGISGNTGAGIAELERCVEKAVGTNI